MTAVVVPSPDARYVELAGGQRWRKHVLTVGPGQSLIHPVTGQRIELGEDFWHKLKRNWDNKVAPIVQLPMVGPDNKHTEAVLDNGGQVVDLQRDGSKVYAVIEARKPEVAEGLRNGTIMGASAFLNLDYTDTRTGKKVGPARLHVAATNRPYLTDLDGYEPIAASAGENGLELMLSHSAEPAQITYPASEPRMTMTAAVELTNAELEPDFDRMVTEFVALTAPQYADDLTIAAMRAQTRDAAEMRAAERGLGRSESELCAAPSQEIADFDRSTGMGGEISFSMAETATHEMSTAPLSVLLSALDDEVARIFSDNPKQAGPMRPGPSRTALVALAGGDDGYALEAGDCGDKPRLPCDSPEAVLRSWEVLHTHYRKRLSAADFADARSELLLDAADSYGMTLHDPYATNLDPDGTPSDVAASYVGLAADGLGDSVDPELTEADMVAARLAANRATARYFSQARRCTSCGVTKQPVDFGGARNVRCTACRSGAGSLTQNVTRPGGQTYSPSQGGTVDAEIARLVSVHGDRGGFGAEQPSSSSGPVRPGQRGTGKQANRASGSAALSMAAPARYPGGSYGGTS